MTSLCCDCGANFGEREPHKSWCPVEKASFLAKQKQLVAQWEDVPIGTAVIVTKDDGTEVATTTRSHGQMLGGHTPVIWVDGIAGCYLLERVRLNKPEADGDTVRSPDEPGLRRALKICEDVFYWGGMAGMNKQEEEIDRRIRAELGVDEDGESSDNGLIGRCPKEK